MNKKIGNLIVAIFLLSIFILPPFASAQMPPDPTYTPSTSGGYQGAPVYPSNSSNSGSGSGSGWSVSSVGNFGLPGATLMGIIKGILQFLLAAIGIVGIIGFVVSGIMYLLSFGDDDRMKTAKNAMYYSITGVIVGLVGFVAIQAIDAMLNGSSVF